MKELDGQFNSGDSDAELVDALRSLQPLAPQVDWGAIHAARSGSEEEAIEASAGVVGKTSNFGSNLMVWWSGVACGAVVAGLLMQWFVISDLQSKVRSYEEKKTGALSTFEPHSAAIARDSDKDKDTRDDFKPVRIGPSLTVRSFRAGAFLTGLDQIDQLESADIGSSEDGNDSLAFRGSLIDGADEVPPVVGRLELLEQLLSDIR